VNHAWSQQIILVMYVTLTPLVSKAHGLGVNGCLMSIILLVIALMKNKGDCHAQVNKL